MNKAAILILVLIVVVAGGWYLMSSNSAPTDTAPATTNPAEGTVTNPPGTTATETPAPVKAQPAASAPVTVTVSYTDKGFVPATVSITSGDSVTFVNNSSRAMWVASNPHPTHTGYPGFDEMAKVANGGSYTFNFTKVGAFGYHNHLSTGDQGVIVVN